MLTRTDVSAAVIRLKGDGDGPAWRCTARDARLFLFPPGIAIASILSNPIWQAGTGTSQVSDFHLSDALDFLDYARRCYPPFWFKQGNCFRAGKVAAHFEWRDRNNQRIGQASDFDPVESSYLQPVRESRTVAVAAHWKSLLAPLQPDPGAGQRGKDKDCLYFAQVADDRLALLAWISVDNPTEISAGDWYRLAFSDDSGKSAGYPYSEAFLKKQSDCFYDRFWDPPAWTTRYACSGYALVAVGNAADEKFTEHVREHMARHYYVLGLLAHLQKASLLYFWQRLSDTVHKFAQAKAGETIRSELREDQRWHLQDLTDFVSRFYFIEVSNQLQARELFSLWRISLGMDELYRDVRDQMEFVGEVIETNYQSKLAAAAHRLLPPAVAGAVTAALFAIPGIIPAMANWSERWYRPVPWLLSLLAGAAIFLVAALLAHVVLRLRWPLFKSRLSS